MKGNAMLFAILTAVILNVPPMVIADCDGGLALWPVIGMTINLLWEF